MMYMDAMREGGQENVTVRTCTVPVMSGLL